MLTTPHAEWAERARRLREHAMSVSAAARHASVLAPPEEYLEVGYNYRMTDLQAAVGIVQLGRLPEVVARRREIAATYAKQIAELPGPARRRGPGVGHRATSSRSGSRSGRSSRSTATGCWPTWPTPRSPRAAGSWRRTASPPTRAPPHAPLPVTEHLTDSTLILPVFHQMSESEQSRVVDALRVGGGLT